MGCWQGPGWDQTGCNVGIKAMLWQDSAATRGVCRSKERWVWVFDQGCGFPRQWAVVIQHVIGIMYVYSLLIRYFLQLFLVLMVSRAREAVDICALPNRKVQKWLWIDGAIAR